MVDPVGPRQSANIDRRLSPVAPVVAPQPVQPAAQASVTRADPSTLRTIAQAVAQQAPVDHERVARIKKAIEEGSFPLIPSTVADRLLALKLQWRPGDQQA